MKSKIKRHWRSVISVVLAVCMLVSCMTVGLIATDAAKVTDAEALGASGNNGESLGASEDSEPVGSGLYLLYGTSNKPSDLTNIGATITQDGTTYTIVLPTGKTFYTGTNYYFALSSETDRTGIFFSRNYYSDVSLSVSKDNSNKFSSVAEQTYNQTDDGTSTSYSYRMARVTFAQQVDTSNTGITITVDSAARSYLFETTGSVNYNVTVSSDANGSVTAGTTTVNAGGSATVSTNSTGISLTANPASGYTFEKWTVTGGATVDSTTSRSTTLKATAAGTVTASFKESSTQTKTIYYDNSTTKWTTPYAFAWTEGVANYLGEWPGSPMTLHKGKVWKIEVSTDAEQIIFSGKGSNQTKDLTIPTDGKDYYKNGEWITYSDSTSGNHYTATLGSTITGNKNLYSNINATFYDYYTDHEYNGNWYSSIDAWEDGWVQNNGTAVGTRNPYTKLNTSLSEYAAKTANDVTYPMYFGSFYNGNYNEPNYTRSSWNDGGGWINDSNNLGGNNKALTGLSGKTITNGNINHYKQGVTDENGAPMVLFDEDWLTSRNAGTATTSNTDYTNGDALATIINSNFPVRKTTTKNITFDVSSATWWNGNNARTWAHLWDDTDNYKDVYLGYGATSYTFSSAGYNHVLFVRVNNTNTSSFSWNDVWNQTVDLTISGDNNKFTLSNSDKDGDKRKGSWSSITAQTSDYYEFNSGNATDNIWFDNLTSGSPVMQYGAGKNYGQKSGYGAQYGFYPFDKYTDTKNSEVYSKAYAKDQGFGLKLEIDFTLGSGGKLNGVDQEFNFSGDDDLWVFVDDQLILDLGGDHKKTNGSINFANKHVYVSPAAASIQSLKSATAATRNSTFTIDNNNTNKVHKMTIFYMERGMHESNLKFGFNFTPVGNEFLTEKQVSDRNVNTGFGTAVMDVAKDDSFTFTHSTSSTDSGEYTPSAGKKYVLNDAATTTDTTSNGTFVLKHGDTADFIDQFTKDTYFKITESANTNNKFSYTPNLTVSDMVTKDVISPTSSGSYKFLTTKANPTALDATRIEAFFTNTIETQTLTVTKKIPTYYDPDSNFTVKVDVSFDGGTTYTAYPLTFTKNGTTGALTGTGTTTLKRNESIVIAGIPKNAMVRVYETNMPSNYDFASYSVTKADNTTVSAAKYENGCSFTLEDNDTVTLNNSPYRYSITYKYQSRLYGEQTYSVSGVFTENEYTDANVNSKVSLKTAFLKKYAPYEDNFMKTLTLDFNNPNINTYSGGTYTAVLTFNLGDITKPRAVIAMPYAHDDKASGFAATKDSSGKVAENANTPDVDVEADEYLGHFKAGGKYIEAPLEIYEGSTKKNFQYWTLNTLVSGRKGDFVTNNYSTKLNYTAYEDYYIEAVYSEADRPSISGQGTYTTITYLEDSRNQWNNGGGGSSPDLKEGWLDHGDQIYVDFDLAFYDGDKLLQNPAESEGITTGLIIQKAGDLQANGSSYHYNDETYTNQINNTLKGQEKPDDVKNFISTGDQPTTSGKCVKLDIATKDLDNKNRIEYFYGLSNKSISTGDPTKIKTYIYRAYSYIKVGGSVTLSDPVYFNVYETATRGYEK